MRWYFQFEISKWGFGGKKFKENSPCWVASISRCSIIIVTVTSIRWITGHRSTPVTCHFDTCQIWQVWRHDTYLPLPAAAFGLGLHHSISRRFPSNSIPLHLSLATWNFGEFSEKIRWKVREYSPRRPFWYQSRCMHACHMSDVVMCNVITTSDRLSCCHHMTSSPCHDDMMSNVITTSYQMSWPWLTPNELSSVHPLVWQYGRSLEVFPCQKQLEVWLRRRSRWHFSRKESGLRYSPGHYQMSIYNQNYNWICKQIFNFIFGFFIE